MTHERSQAFDHVVFPTPGRDLGLRQSPGLMKAIAREEAQVLLDAGGVEFRTHEIGGDMTVAFIRVPAGWDLGPLLVGLPDDLCQCPHWGYVLSGRLGLRTKDGEDVYAAGQAFYWSPGHAPKALEDSEYVEFSPTSGLNDLIDHIRPQLA